MPHHRHVHGHKSQKGDSNAAGKEKTHPHSNGENESNHHHGGERQRVRVRAKDTPGVICIERRTHDEAIVISGSLTVDYDNAEIGAWIEQELETAAQGIRDQGGIVGHIKAALSVTATSMISVTDEKAMSKESPLKRARISLAAIVFKVDPKEAENIIRKSLAGVRSRLRNSE